MRLYFDCGLIGIFVVRLLIKSTSTPPPLTNVF